MPESVLATLARHRLPIACKAACASVKQNCVSPVWGSVVLRNPPEPYYAHRVVGLLKFADQAEAALYRLGFQ